VEHPYVVAPPTTAVAPLPPPAPTLQGPVPPAVSALAGLRAGQISAAFYNLNSGQGWVLAGQRREDTASIVKLQILAATLYADQQHGTQPSGTQDSLATAMIEASDNDAATTLWDDAGGAPGIGTFDHSVLGLSQTVPSDVAVIPGTTLPGWGLTTTSATDQITLLHDLVTANAVLDPAAQAYALNCMEHVEADQDWGVSAGVPAAVTVALKNGWLPLAGQGWQVNSVGWIDGQGRDYLLAVLTAGNPTEQYGIDTIQALSAQAWAQAGPGQG
jgi:beta-lactamase class A